jgi:hypothetical protein
LVKLVMQRLSIGHGFWFAARTYAVANVFEFQRGLAAEIDQPHGDDRFAVRATAFDAGFDVRVHAAAELPSGKMIGARGAALLCGWSWRASLIVVAIVRQ